MASLFRDPESGNFKIKFRHAHIQYKWSLRHSDEVLANETLARVERTLRDIEEGRLVIPDGADVVHFVKTDGERTAPLKAPEKPITLGILFEVYQAELTRGAKAKNTLDTNLIHRRHLVRVLGQDRPLSSLAAPGGLQEYVDKRSREKWRGDPIKARTVKKEVGTLGTVWRWASTTGRTSIPFPDNQIKGLVYPIEKGKPPFRTWGEIERIISQRNLSEEQRDELWECLYLDLEQVKGVLEHVRKHSDAPVWLYPALLFVAHTGARRSEMLRSEVQDFDWAEGVVHIREKKRKKGKLSRRHVPMSSEVKSVFRDYFDRSHAGGRFSICIDPRAAEKVTNEEDIEAYVERAAKRAWKAFRYVLRGSKWEVLHGYHVFRHSIISNMARNSVDQRLIDGIVGHETEAMRARYRHLFPRDKQDVVKSLFG